MQFKKGSAFTKVLSLALAIMVSASSLLGGTAFAAETSVQDASTVNTLSTAANAEEEEDFTVVENYALNGTMEEDTNGALTYWMPDLKDGSDDNTIAKATSIRYGDVNIGRHDGYFAAIRPNSSYVPYEAALEQLMVLPNGTYTLSAYVYSVTTEEDKENGGYAKMYVYEDDGLEAIEVDLEATGAWTQVVIPDVTITNGKCRIGFGLKSVGSDEGTARALAVDNVVLSIPAGTINGTVTDPDGATVPNATVKVKDSAETVASITTGSDGTYEIDVPAGDDFVVTAAKAGFRSVSEEGVTFTEGEATTLDLQFTEMVEENAYYVDADFGDDSNDGTSPERAWKTIAKLNETVFQPGDTILFKAGCSWEGETFKPQGNGEEGNPIYVGKYGDEDLYPAIHANYVPGTPLAEMETNNKNALEITGISYWEFHDLELTNYGIYNDDSTANEQKGRRAVTIRSSGGTMEDIVLDGLYIHDVNGWNPKANDDNGAAISFGANGQTYIDGLTIENCLIKDVTRDGITGGGYTGTRPWGWNSWDMQNGVPLRHKNVVIRNNVLDTIAGDGIVATGTYEILVEHNLVTHASNNPIPYPNQSGNARTNLSAAVWPFDADNSIFQYNEVCYTGVPRGTEVADGEAFDSDYYCVNTLFQYNYSHDNEGGFLMICGPAYAYSDGTVVRYNISENDGSMHGKRTIFEIGGGGGVDHSYIYNNTIYTSEDHSVFSVMRGEPWDGKPKGTNFINNIFAINGTVAQFGFAGDPRDKGKEGVVTYNHNLYTGTLFEGTLKDMPDDPNAVFGDPKFVDPGNAGDGYENAKAYQIQEGSAAIGAGLQIDQSWLGQKLDTVSYTAGNGSTAENKAVYFHVDGEEFQWQDPNGGIDFFGNPLPTRSAPDIGAHQFSVEPPAPEEHTLTVRFNLAAQMVGEGMDIDLANKLGMYSTQVMGEDPITFTFVPTAEGREFRSIKVNGEPVAFDEDTDTYSYTYEGTMANQDTELVFEFEVVSKLTLVAAIEEAEALVGGEEYNTVIASVRERFDKALENAKSVRDDNQSTQQEIDDARNELLEVIPLLSLTAGDTTALESLLAVVGQLDEADYTTSSWAALQEKVSAAEAVVEEEEPLKTEVDEAYEALYDALTALEYRADTSSLEALVARALEIDAVLDTEYLEAGQEEFKEALAAAQDVLANVDATQEEVEDAASALNQAMANLRKIPDKSALEALVQELSAISGDDYTAQSYAALRASLNIAMQVLEDPNATQEEVDSAIDACNDAKEKLTEVHHSSNSGSGSSSSGSSSSSGKTSGEGTAVAVPSAVVAAAQGVAAQQAYVRSDTTLPFTLKHGQAYCFKMTAVGTEAVPSFTVGNGDVLKTQFVAQIGNDYYYRVYATGTPGESTGVYTTLPGNAAVKHCTVTIA